VRTLAGALREMGHSVSHETVAKLLRGLGYSLQANRKMTEGASHPDRDAQFQHIQPAGSAVRDGDSAGSAADGSSSEEPQPASRPTSARMSSAWGRRLAVRPATIGRS